MHKEIVARPLELLGIRKVEFLPSHFEKLVISLPYNLVGAVEKWIICNLKGRYSIGKHVILNGSNKLETALQIGFEDPKEASYFMLACPLLKYN